MSISLELLKQAIKIKEQIAKLETRLVKLLKGGGGEGPFPFLKSIKKGRRKMSAAVRAKIGAAQRKRWARQKDASIAKPAKKKRKLSAAGRARIVAAQKKRWAKKNR